MSNGAMKAGMRVPRPKYLKQAITGRVYVWTEILARRKDMSDYDPDLAEARKSALRRRIEELDAIEQRGMDPKVISDAEEITKLEQEIAEKEAKILQSQIDENGGSMDAEEPKTEEDLVNERREKIINDDPEIKKIEAFTTKQQVIDYIAEEYGQSEEVDKDTKLEVYKAKAYSLRVNRLFETE